MQIAHAIAAIQQPPPNNSGKNSNTKPLRVLIAGTNSVRGETILATLAASHHTAVVLPLTKAPLESTDRKVSALAVTISPALKFTPQSVDVVVCIITADNVKEQPDNIDRSALLSRRFLDALKARTQNYLPCTSNDALLLVSAACAAGAKAAIIISAEPYIVSMGNQTGLQTKNELALAALPLNALNIIRMVAPFQYQATKNIFQRIANMWLKQLEYMIPDKYQPPTNKQLAQIIEERIAQLAIDWNDEKSSIAKIEVTTPTELQAQLKTLKKG